MPSLFAGGGGRLMRVSASHVVYDAFCFGQGHLPSGAPLYLNLCPRSIVPPLKDCALIFLLPVAFTAAPQG